MRLKKSPYKHHNFKIGFRLSTSSMQHYLPLKISIKDI